jgi:hypothetical protein
MVSLLLRRGDCHRRLDALQPAIPAAHGFALVGAGNDGDFLRCRHTQHLFHRQSHLGQERLAVSLHPVAGRRTGSYLVWHDKPDLPMLSDGSLIIGSGLLIALAAHNTQVALRPTSPADEACARFSNCQSAAPLTRPGGRLSLSILLIWHFSLGNALWRFGLNPEAILATCVSTGSSWTMRPRRPSASVFASLGTSATK